VKIKTSRFGDLEIDGGKILFLPEGVLGFPAHKRYILLDDDRQGPFIWLQAVDNPELAFIVIDPLALDESFDVRLYPKDLSELKADGMRDVSFLVIVTVRREEPPCIILNMQGPLAINHKKLVGKQLVLSSHDVPVLLVPQAS